MGFIRYRDKNAISTPGRCAVFIPSVPDKPRRHGRGDRQPYGPRDARRLGRRGHDAEEVVDVSRALWFDICIVSHDRYDQTFPELVRALAEITDCVCVQRCCSRWPRAWCNQCRGAKRPRECKKFARGRHRSAVDGMQRLRAGAGHKCGRNELYSQQITRLAAVRH